jgi:hypothetical protein
MTNKNDELAKLTAAESTAERAYIEALKGHDSEATRRAAAEWSEAARKVTDFYLANPRAGRDKR